MNQCAGNIPTKVINERIYWIHYCPQCNKEMPYSGKSNFYRSRKFKRRCQSCANPMKNPEISKKFLGDLNPSKRKSFRDWMSKNNPMYEADIIKKHKIACNKSERRNAIRQHMISHNPSKIPGVIEKRIDTYTKRLAAGLYTIKNNWKTGYYTRKNGEKEWYDSSYELKKMEEYDINGIQWTKKHKIRIPYVNKNGMKTYYVPDFFINGNTIEEIKGWIKDTDVVKAHEAIEFCKHSGWNYRFLVGKDMKLNTSLSYECT